jgi:hypothetical protein
MYYHPLQLDEVRFEIVHQLPSKKQDVRCAMSYESRWVRIHESTKLVPNVDVQGENTWWRQDHSHAEVRPTMMKLQAIAS